MAQSAPTPRPGILDIAAYVGGEAHAPGSGRQIRLASNEGALGPSQQVYVAVLARANNGAAAAIAPAGAVVPPFDVVAPTPAQIADVFEDWFVDGACDGFILPPTVFPATFEEFGRMVVPELQRRGLFRTEYSYPTLRENLRDDG